MTSVGVRGRSVPAPIYLDGIRLAKANPDVTFKYGLRSEWPTTGREIMAEYRRDLHERITRRGGSAPATSRVSLFTWGLVSAPRVILDRHDFKKMNRHQKPRLWMRVREDY